MEMVLDGLDDISAVVPAERPLDVENEALRLMGLEKPKE